MQKDLKDKNKIITISSQLQLIQNLNFSSCKNINEYQKKIENKINEIINSINIIIKKELIK